ncbi:MAG: SIR2 family protein, partial [Tannerella sp.]|nr:SIR2 family protein [Tannerella sp.]
MTIPYELKEAIKKNRLVLFVGAGLSCKLKNLAGQPIGDWSDLTGRILDLLETKGCDVADLKPLVEKREPIHILKLAEEHLQRHEREVRAFTSTFFSLATLPANDYTLHRNLYKLSATIVTTNYDDAFEKALYPSTLHIAHKGKSFESSLLRQAGNKPVLFKLH